MSRLHASNGVMKQMCTSVIKYHIETTQHVKG